LGNGTEDAAFQIGLPHQISEATLGLRTVNVRATAYVGGKLAAEQIRGVDELSAYFVPAVVARREALAALLRRATQPGDETAEQ
jgi:hypothetical protein